MDDNQIPVAVLKKIGAVVCLRVGSGEPAYSFTGFFTGRQGLLLTVAREVSGHEVVRVLSAKGVAAEGRILKLDLENDLAVIKVQGYQGASISLEDDRSKVHIGGPVFGFGCREDQGATPLRGTINGPVRRVGKFPFWQMSMELVPGSSGAPVFDSEGYFLGVVKGSYLGTKNVGLLIPADTVVRFMSSLGLE
ncbi:MAG: serine protease [Thermodesulfobacteriota bacterium]